MMQADGLNEDLEILEMELSILMRKLLAKDLYATERLERVWRAAKQRDLIERELH